MYDCGLCGATSQSKPCQCYRLSESNETDCSTVFDAGLPMEIVELIERCEINEHSFSNEDMSVALKFGESLWKRLAKMAEHYDRQTSDFQHSVRSCCISAAVDMRHVLADTRKDL